MKLSKLFNVFFLIVTLITVTVASGQFNESLPPYVQPSSDTDASLKSVKLSTGVRLEYFEKGSTSGTPVIFLHGYTDSWRSFEQVMPFLPESIHAYVVSQRGHGQSDRPVHGYDPGDFASDISDFMQELKIPSAIIVGHSMGATVAQRFALDYPYLAKAVVLVGSFASFKTNQGIAELQSIVGQIEDPLDSGFVNEFQKSTIFRPIPTSSLRTYVTESMKVPARVWKAVAQQSLSVDYSEELKSLSMPVLIIWGDKDNFCPEADQHVFVKAIRKSTLLIYQGTGHAVHWEDPERFARDLVSFIDQTQTNDQVVSEIDLKEHFLSGFFY